MPKPEEPNSDIDNSSDEMSKEFSSEDRNEATREWTLSECQERCKSLKDAQLSGSGLSMKEWEKRNGEGIW
ncbi:hypothetical protein [Prochlorococcus sp. MIT 1306]|uniref:hypothetical protein n=1 Tax=Prochlorococcus sp. MIT 1306 TaxID=1799667 RepID=UPI0007BB0BB1|nr:hypothetical protein [Prochlorococcus sp. MIT 1306]KZR66529.1 hypothetical protein PMIT1306_00115 [Prochlorococcus sp. MIT 1306]